jgi:dihydrofolate reductase
MIKSVRCLTGLTTETSSSAAATPAWCSIYREPALITCARAWSNIAVYVIGRHLFDLTNGWNGRPAVGEAVFVVTHEPPTDWPFPDAPFSFVTDGAQSAVAQAQAFAGDKDVSLTAGSLVGQALRAGLVDELRIDLVPVVFGSGVRYFGNYDESTLLLEDPEIVQGGRVTHLHHRIRK